MEATILSWRFQNILSIAVILIGLGVMVTLGSQLVKGVTAQAATGGS